MQLPAGAIRTTRACSSLVLVARFLVFYRLLRVLLVFFFFFQAEDGIRDHCVTGVQTCALPIFVVGGSLPWRRPMNYVAKVELFERRWRGWILSRLGAFPIRRGESDEESMEIGRASCRGRGEISVVAVSLKKKKKEV